MAEKSFDGQNALSSQGVDWAPLTPHDSTDFPFIPKAIAIGATPGSFVAVSEDGSTGTFYGNAGQIIPIRPKRINTTGMTGGMTFVGLKR
jgi:hypothetical protein